MANWPFKDLITYLKDGVTRALTITGEVKRVGNKIEKSILTRDVYSSGQTFSFDVPEWADSVHILVIVHEVTGTSPELEIRTGPTYRNFTEKRRIAELHTTSITTSGRAAHIYAKGANNNDNIANNGLDLQRASIIASDRFDFSFPITGTFEEGEGFDMEAHALIL